MRHFIYEPYRLFFPVGTLFLLWGILLWLPQIWSPGNYPVLMHRFLVLNGFVSMFVGGFLMTAIPKFSKTFAAKAIEVCSFLLMTLLGLGCAYSENEKCVYLFSAAQALILLIFLFSRIFRRQENPPYSFVFIFVGLGLWLFPELHYEGSIAAIIFGVGSRLIPGILGHVEIVRAQRESYENPRPIFMTVPWYFYLLILSFVGSYFLNDLPGSWLRAMVVVIIGIIYWQLYKAPKDKTSLTWCIWTSSWLIVLSFVLKAVWQEGMIHASHAFFINGILLLSLLIATRVLQSHGPKLKSLENWKGLYVVTALVFLAACTRISAYLMPDTYFTHLGYSSLILAMAVAVWGWKYLRYVTV